MKSSKGLKIIIAGLIFSILWASASTATKIGLTTAQPFVLFVTRFFIAGFIMLAVAHLFMRQPMPSPVERRKLAVYGLLNISIYLGFYVVGMQFCSAGIGSLFIAANPIFMSLISAAWLKKPVTGLTIISLLICTAGILTAAYPLLRTSYVTPVGLVLLTLAMISYSVSALYFARNQWNLHIMTINGWQTLFGGLFLLPLLLLTFEGPKNQFAGTFWRSVLWLAVPVSIAAVQLWLYLLRDNPVKASFWLFLCPISGFIMAAWLMQEPLSLFTLVGVLLVLGGLYLVQRQRKA